MNNTTSLPQIMVAPNGARRNKSHHKAIPISHVELVETAIACQNAGADGIHLHIRDENAEHLLDAGSYAKLVEGISSAVPEMYLQVTSEAAGKYTAAQQIEMVRALKPANVSVALREMVPDENAWPQAREFYQWAAKSNVSVQHILYSLQELEAFLQALADEKIPGSNHLIQFVLGNYQGTQISRPENIQPLLDLLSRVEGPHQFDWMLCAFGKEETECLAEAVRLGGKARVGFENSLWNSDGSTARDNAERVAEVVSAIRAF